MSEFHVDSKWLAGLQTLYSSPAIFSRENLAAYYHDNAVFIDPVEKIQGIASMMHYFNHAYKNLDDCQFRFEKHSQCNEQIFIVWKMHLRHRALNNGKPLVIDGISHLELMGEKIVFHRDYYDVSSMLHDNLPLLGQVSRWLKRKLAP